MEEKEQGQRLCEGFKHRRNWEDGPAASTGWRKKKYAGTFSMGHM